MPFTPAQSIAHDLTNKLTAVTGFICLEEYAKAQQCARDAAELASTLQRCLRIHEELTTN